MMHGRHQDHSPLMGLKQAVQMARGPAAAMRKMDVPHGLSKGTRRAPHEMERVMNPMRGK